MDQGAVEGCAVGPLLAAARSPGTGAALMAVLRTALAIPGVFWLLEVSLCDEVSRCAGGVGST
jgi:hypothetical protein